MARKILLIDDDNALLTLNAMFFSLNGFETSTCCNGQEALELIPTLQPDIIVMDLIMPVMDGNNFLSNLGLRKDGREYPVIVLSGVKQSEISNEVIQRQNIEIIHKPVDPEELLKKINIRLPD